jgi:hypothetical protein
MSSSVIQCPFCGETMAAPLKFCTSCGRAVSANEIQKVGLKIVKDKRGVDLGGGGRFAISRRDYGGQRQMRNFFMTSSMILVLVICYYVAMKYVFHEHIPGNLDVMMERALRGEQIIQPEPKAPEPAVTQPEPEPQPAPTKPHPKKTPKRTHHRH